MKFIKLNVVKVMGESKYEGVKIVNSNSIVEIRPDTNEVLIRFASELLNYEITDASMKNLLKEL